MREQESHAITQARFNAVQLGVSTAVLEQDLGKQPENSQEFVNQGVLGSGQINSSCVYYNKTGEAFGSTYQFCFDNGELSSKNAY